MDNDEESGGLIVLNTPEQGNSIEKCDDINDTAAKISGIVKQFKRSRLKNETLQKYVRETHPNGLQLILDCTTRLVQKSLLDLGASVDLSDHD